MKSIKEKIELAINNHDVLFIVPPFMRIRGNNLGIHNLQMIAQSSGFSADILYLNMLFASEIGFQFYEEVYNAPLYWMLTDRLFARAAYGLPPLGYQVDNITNQSFAIDGPVENEIHRFLDNIEFNSEKYYQLEKQCYNFIQETAKIISAKNYNIIGISSLIGHTNSGVALINGIKKNAPETITIMGGPNCSGQMAYGVKSLSENIDYVFADDSEDTFRAFLNDIKKGIEIPSKTIHPKQKVDLNSLQLPDFSSYFKQTELFLKDKLSDEEIELYYETSRGCEWGQRVKCNFCGVADTRLRKKSPEKVIEEISILHEKWPGKMIYCTDEMMPDEYFEKVLPILHGKNISSLLYMQRPKLTLEQLMLLQRANVKRMVTGIEALSNGLLRLMNKGVTLKDNLLMLRNAHCVNMRLQWFFIWGLPGDKIEDYKKVLELIPFIKHFQAPFGGFIHVKFYRYSNFFEFPEKYNIKNFRPWHVYNLVFPEYADFEKLAYRFTCEYSCESHQKPKLINEINEEIMKWENEWRNLYLVMIPNPINNSEFIIIDKRNVNKKEKTYIIDDETAKEIMMPKRTQSITKNMDWALEKKLAINIDNWYIPLVTTKPEILLNYTDN